MVLIMSAVIEKFLKSVTFETGGVLALVVVATHHP